MTLYYYIDRYPYKPIVNNLIFFRGCVRACIVSGPSVYRIDNILLL